MSMIFSVLSARLAAITGKSELSCRGVMRYVISDTAPHLKNTTDSKIWQEYMEKMNFQDWDTLLQGHALLARLASIGTKDPREVAMQLRQTLVEKQSLFTISTIPGR